jgi:hypothetical protein
MIKPGYRTSEFWFTLVSFIFSGLYLTGIINDHTNKEELISVVSHAVESCILIGGQFVILYKYINSRKNIKTEITPEVVNTPPVVNEEKKDDKPRKSRTTKKPRTNTKRSRKTDK